MPSTPVRPAAPPVTVRAATTSDEPALRTIIAAAYRQYETVLSPAIFAAYLADLLEVVEGGDGAEVLVADVDGRPVGSVTYYPDGSSTGLGWPEGWPVFRALAVAPDGRGSGAGRALVDACIERAAAAGAPAIGLHTATLMTAAVRLYERAGFERAPAFDLTATDVLGVHEPDVPQVIAYRLALTGTAP